MATLTPSVKQQFFDANGDPLSGGKLYTYAAGTTTPLATYTDSGAGTPNTNPIVLNSRGEANVWLGSAAYKFKLTTSAEVEIWTVDNVSTYNYDVLQTYAASGGSALIGFLQAGSGAAARTVQSKLRDAVSVKDFGAVGNGVADDTAAIQSAINACNASTKALFVPAGTYICGQITTYPETTIIGEGRIRTQFKAKAGTTGIWWGDRGNGAQKLYLVGLAWYANSEAGITDIAQFGVTGIQYGTEGLLSDLWFRDAPSGVGLYVNSNVGVYRAISIQNCDTNIKIRGDANQVSGLVSMSAGSVGADLYGCYVDRMEIEATATGGTPLKIYGDCVVRSLVVSPPNGATYSHIIEVDTTAYTTWTVQDAAFIGFTPTVTNGILKIGASYYGGTSTAAANGLSYSKNMILHGTNFGLKLQLFQAFCFRLYNNSGTIQHRIGANTDSSLASVFAFKINGASNSYNNTPTGADASTAFVAGAKIGNPTKSIVILDTATQVNTDVIVQAQIVNNTSTTALTAWAYTITQDVNGVTRTRIVIQFLNAATGAAYDLTTLPSGAILDVNVIGFVA